MSNSDNSDEEALLAALPDDGSFASNAQVVESLGWSTDRYWPVRDLLREQGRVERGRGRGGTVRRVPAAISEENPPPTRPEEVAEIVATDVAVAYQREIQLYDPARASIEGGWAKDRGVDPVCVEITAQQGRRQTGGRWSRPDIVLVEVKPYTYVPSKVITVITFEVKNYDWIDISAVYEALAHRRGATHSYVLVHVPQDQASSLEDSIEEVRIVARSHGIGMIVAEDPADYSTWTEYEEAIRHEPDPRLLNEFIERQLPDSSKQAIALRLR